MITPVPQPGITATPTEHLLTAALTFAQRDAASARASIETLRGVLRRELASDLDEIVAGTDKTTSSAETGELGVADGWDLTGLTIDVAFSASCFDALGLTAGTPNRPGDISEVPWASFGMAPAIQMSGDVLLHIRADDQFVAEHALRRVEHTLAGQFTVLWSLAGTQRYSKPGSDLSSREARSLNGFHDGLSNLSPHVPDDAELIFVDPSKVSSYPVTPPSGPQNPPAGSSGYNPGGQTGPSFPEGLRPAPTAEPGWTAGGSYVFVRGSVLDIERWDSRTLGTQEATVGRFKSSGAFLDNNDTRADRDDAPQFASAPTNVRVPLNSHVRRANPRTPSSDDAARRILRRGYPMTVASGASTLQRGLLFVSFSRSLSTQIEFIMSAWLANKNFPTPGSGIDPLLAFETSILAGGYYFMPALSDPDEPTSWALPAA